MSANDSASKTNAGVAKSPNPPGNDETALNNTQIWGSVTNASPGQNSVHYPATVAYPYDPSQIATPAYDMGTYASATPLYQYSPFQYPNDGYQQSYDENFQSGETLTGYDGSSSQYPPYSVPIDQNSYFVGAQDGQTNAVYGKKQNLSLFDTSSENYTAHWVSSTTKIPADLKVSPDHPSDSVPGSNDFPSVNWNETQTDSFTPGAAGSGQNQTFNAASQVQQEALDQQLAQMNLGYNVQQQQYTGFGYPGTGGNAGQAWQANFPPPDSRTDQNNGQSNRSSGFYGQTSNGTGEFGASPGSTSQKASAGAPGQASWAEMVKKNGAHSGEIRHQPPPTSAANGGSGQNYQGVQRNSQNFQRGNQSGQSQGVRNFNSQRTYQNNNTGPNGVNNRQNNGLSRNSYSAVSPNQQVPYIPGPYYGAQPQNGLYNNRGNNGYNQRNNSMGQRIKQPQNVRPNVGYAGFNNNRLGAAGPPPGYNMPTEFNPFVPPPPLIPLGHRPTGNGPGAGLQQPQGGPLFAAPPYIMFNPAQQQFRYFNNQQFIVRPEPLMPSMYPNDPYFQMRFRPPFDFDPRFGPPMFSMPRYRNRGNNQRNGRGNKYQNNRQPRPNSKSDVNSVSPRDDKENKKEGEKLDEELAESVNRGPEFELGNGPTPEPKGDIQIVEEKKHDKNTAEKTSEEEEFKFPIENLEKEEAAKENSNE